MKSSSQIYIDNQDQTVGLRMWKLYGFIKKIHLQSWIMEKIGAEKLALKVNAALFIRTIVSMD